MNTTGIDLLVRACDAARFEFESEVESERFPGLVEISTGDAIPAELHRFSDRPFVGMHGSHAGDYSASLVACAGDGRIHTHPCDESGQPSLWLDVYDPESQPRLDERTTRFVRTFRRILQDMCRRESRQTSSHDS